MLKFLRLGVALIAVLVTPISTTFLTSPANAANVTNLNAQLKQSVCTQNWGEAVKIIDQMIAITPSSNQTQHNELQTSRVRMQNLSISRTNVDSWLETYCPTPVANSPITTNTTKINRTTTDNASRVVKNIMGERTVIGTSNSPLKILRKGVIPCSEHCIKGINDYYIAVEIINDGNELKQIHLIEYQLVLKSFNQVIDTGYVYNTTGSSTLKPQDRAILQTDFSSDVLPKGSNINDLDVIFLASPLDE